jgi:hypothetical protein
LRSNCGQNVFSANPMLGHRIVVVDVLFKPA